MGRWICKEACGLKEDHLLRSQVENALGKSLILILRAYYYDHHSNDLSLKQVNFGTTYPAFRLVSIHISCLVLSKELLADSPRESTRSYSLNPHENKLLFSTQQLPLQRLLNLLPTIRLRYCLSLDLHRTPSMSLQIATAIQPRPHTGALLLVLLDLVYARHG